MMFTANVVDQIIGGTFTVHLMPDTILTLTASTGQTKGSHNIPASEPLFPVPYKDNFECECSIRVYLK